MINLEQDSNCHVSFVDAPLLGYSTCMTSWIIAYFYRKSYDALLALKTVLLKKKEILISSSYLENRWITRIATTT